MTSAPYVVGIDLGTTNSALAEADARLEPSARPSVDVPQVVSPGEVRRAPLLPSFLYLPGATDLPAGATALPWDRGAGRRRRVRARARRREPGAARLVREVVAVARGRRSAPPILPWRATDDVRDACRRSTRRRATSRTSPRAWDTAIPTAAARRAGRARHRARVVRRGRARADGRGGARAGRASTSSRCSRSRRPRSTLARATRRRWRDAASRSATSCWSCDVGGGTTDFSLIAVTRSRTATLTLDACRRRRSHPARRRQHGSRARRLVRSSGSRPRARELDALQSRLCGHAAAREGNAARRAARRQRPVTMLGRGTKLIGGTIEPSSHATSVERSLVDGFFPSGGCGGATRARERRAVCRRSGCPTPPIPRSRATWRDSWAQLASDVTRATGAACDAARRPGAADARPVQRRRDEGRRLASAARDV